MKRNYWTTDYAVTFLPFNLHCVRSFVFKVIVVTVVANRYSQLTMERPGFCGAYFCEAISHFLDPVGIVWALIAVVPIQDGWTAMMFACQAGHEHVVEALLKGRATVDIQDEVIPVIIWQCILLHYTHNHMWYDTALYSWFSSISLTYR